MLKHLDILELLASIFDLNPVAVFNRHNLLLRFSKAVLSITLIAFLHILYQQTAFRRNQHKTMAKQVDTTSSRLPHLPPTANHSESKAQSVPVAPPLS